MGSLLAAELLTQRPPTPETLRSLAGWLGVAGLSVASVALERRPAFARPAILTLGCFGLASLVVHVQRLATSVGEQPATAGSAAIAASLWCALMFAALCSLLRPELPGVPADRGRS